MPTMATCSNSSEQLRPGAERWMTTLRRSRRRARSSRGEHFGIDRLIDFAVKAMADDLLLS